MAEVAEELVGLDEDVEVDHRGTQVLTTALVGALHLGLTHILDDLAQLLTHVLRLLGVLHTLAGDELVDLCDVVDDAVTDGGELSAVLLGDGVVVVVYVLYRYLRSTLEGVDHLQTGIGTEVEPHVLLQHILVAGHAS